LSFKGNKLVFALAFLQPDCYERHLRNVATAKVDYERPMASP